MKNVVAAPFFIQLKYKATEAVKLTLVKESHTESQGLWTSSFCHKASLPSSQLSVHCDWTAGDMTSCLCGTAAYDSA